MGILLKSLGTVVLLSCALTAHAEINHIFTTELQEVRTGSINGREYLTIHIGSSVGPANCQGSVLRVDTQNIDQPGKHEIMGSVAFEAMLTSERVVITVPMTFDGCIDGMPTLTDINLVTRTQ